MEEVCPTCKIIDGVNVCTSNTTTIDCSMIYRVCVELSMKITSNIVAVEHACANGSCRTHVTGDDEERGKGKVHLPSVFHSICR
jgi:hypothetical protein